MNKNILLIINILLFVIVILAGYNMIVFGSQSSKADDQWIYLFDGTTTEGWRAYNGESLPSKWTIKDSVLTFDTNLQLEKDMKGGGDIIYYLEEFENFELYLEWKLPEGGNSGVFYHLKEGFNTPYEVGPEYQLLDDDGWEKINNATLEQWQKAGADYAMYSPNNNKTINSAVAAAAQELGDRGRVLLRSSGTEPLIRGMAEGEDQDVVSRPVEAIAKRVEQQVG